jgi:hypothetical protein
VNEFRLASLAVLLVLANCTSMSSPSPYAMQVSAYKAQMANGSLAALSAIPPTSVDATAVANSGMSPLPPVMHDYLGPEYLAQLDQAKFWWTDTPRPRRNRPAPMVLVVTNTTDKQLNGFVFRLADEPCGPTSPSVDKDVRLPLPIPPASKAAINFDIEISAANVMRKNQPACGQIVEAW